MTIITVIVFVKAMHDDRSLMEQDSNASSSSDLFAPLQSLPLESYVVERFFSLLKAGSIEFLLI